MGLRSRLPGSCSRYLCSSCASHTLLLFPVPPLLLCAWCCLAVSVYTRRRSQLNHPLANVDPTPKSHRRSFPCALRSIPSTIQDNFSAAHGAPNKETVLSARGPNKAPPPTLSTSSLSEKMRFREEQSNHRNLVSSLALPPPRGEVHF